MTRHKCSECPLAMLGTASSHCWHKDNYSELITQEQIYTDAGYDCPLNVDQPDYVSLQRENELRERGSWRLFCERSGLNHLLTAEDYEEKGADDYAGKPKELWDTLLGESA